VTFGCGKSFTARWYQQQAMLRGFAVAEVQISENDTPLHRLETVYRRAMEGLRTAEWDTGAFRAVISQWIMGLEEEVTKQLRDPDDLEALGRGVGDLMEARLAKVSAVQPQYAAVLRAYHAAQLHEDHAVAEGLIAWLMGQPNVSADIKRKAGHQGRCRSHRRARLLPGPAGGPPAVRPAGAPAGPRRGGDDPAGAHPTLATKGLEALRKLIDDLYGGRFAGLYVLITGTPAFFDGPNGVRRLPPLAQRLARGLLGRRAMGQPSGRPGAAPSLRPGPSRRGRSPSPGALPHRGTRPGRGRVDDEVLTGLATAVAGKLGGKVGVAPRIFLRKLVAGLLDRVDLYPDFDPLRDFELSLTADELTVEERAAAGGASPDDFDLEV
jgi:hypothetical protein